MLNASYRRHAPKRDLSMARWMAQYEILTAQFGADLDNVFVHYKCVPEAHPRKHHTKPQASVLNIFRVYF